MISETPRYTGRKISLDFQDADLVNILRPFAEMANFNMILSPEVRGKVTVRMVNVPWDQAMDIILKMNGLGYTKEDNILRIASLAALARESDELAKAKEAKKKAEDLITRIIPINYATAAGVEGTIKKSLSARGETVVDARTNTLIVKDIARNVDEVATLIRLLDKPIPQVKNLISTYHAVAGLKKHFLQLHVRVNSVTTSSNYEHLECLHEEVKSIMPELDCHDMEIVRGTPLDSSYAPPSVAQLEELRPVVSRIWTYYSRRQRFPGSRVSHNMRLLLYDAYLKILDCKKQPWPCWAGNLHCVLDYKGDISPCEMLPTIGNIRKNDFDRIWTSPAADTLRKYISDRKCCCIHSCFQRTNVLLNHRLWPKMVL